MQTATAIIILAAGKSSRLGQPKQLLPYKGKSLLQHGIETAGKAAAHVVVITGAEKSRVESAIADSGAAIVFNALWEEGMASSIREGLTYLAAALPDVTSVIFMVCDQPFVTVDLLQNLMQEKERSAKSIIASHYAGIAGTPVLFDQRIFPELMMLSGDKGARKIISANPDQLAMVDFPLGIVDMDTPEDYQNLLMQKDLL